MKRQIYILFALIVILCSSCNKDCDSSFTGSFTYKLSGKVTFERVPSSPEDTLIINFTREIIAETGQLNLLTRSESNNERVVTMNALGGNVSSGSAKVNANSIDVKIPNKVYRFHGLLDNDTRYYFSTVGKGERLDDYLLFTFACDGEIAIGEERFKIIDSSIECIARLND